jgi:hypothetical protein
MLPQRKFAAQLARLDKMGSLPISTPVSAKNVILARPNRAFLV